MSAGHSALGTSDDGGCAAHPVGALVTRVVLALGSNLGDRLGYLRGAVNALGQAMHTASPVYESPPWGDPDQPHYLNAVIVVGGPATECGYWLAVARQLEDMAGQRREPGRPWGPRTLDVDLITASTPAGQPVISENPGLTLPHPRAHLRAFVLRPWLDVEPDAFLPGHGRVVDLLLRHDLTTDLAALSRRDDMCLQT